MHRIKRIFDILAAGLALTILSPVLVLVGFVVRLTLGSPILFRQIRPGFLAKPFKIYKFRTMREGTLPDEARLHPLGNFLRSTSLDELPELWNVIRGDMSLIGPRPLLMKYLPFYTEEERIRFSVRPGVTGWAQVHGRNGSGWDERLRQDTWYVRNQSFLLDLKILAVTVSKVLKREQVIVDARSAMLNLDEERSPARQEELFDRVTDAGC